MHYNEKWDLVLRKNVAERIYEEDEYYFTNEDFRQYWEEYGITEEDLKEWKEFTSKFEVISRSSLANEDLYYGQNYMFVIRRNEDDKEFGLQYFHGGGKHGEPMFTNEIDDNYETYSFAPVEPFSIPGYRYKEEV